MEADTSRKRGATGPFWRIIRATISGSAAIAGAGILLMMTVTCADVILRRFGSSVPGAYDIVRLAGGVVIATALPLTTAVKGHVAIEYFFRRLGRRERLVIDSAMRVLQTAGFSIAAWSFVVRGSRLLRDGEVTPTLQAPIFWLAWLVAASCALSALASLFHLAKPGKELMAR